MKIFNYYLILLLVVTFFSCGSDKKNSGTDSGTDVDSDGSALKEAVCIWKETALRDGPREKGKYVTTIYLGERMTYLDSTAADEESAKKYQYVKIRLADGTEGWTREEFIAINAKPAAFIKEAPLYKRPDIMTSADKSFATMDFVAIKSSTEDWSEVVGKRASDSWFTTGWVKTDNLTLNSNDVALSVLYQKAVSVSDSTKRISELKKIVSNSDLSTSVFFDLLQSKISTMEGRNIGKKENVDDDVEDE